MSFNPMNSDAFNLYAMEESGLLDTPRSREVRAAKYGATYVEDDDYDEEHSRELNMRVAHYLAKYGSDEIYEMEFRRACIACEVDPDSITQSDINEIRSKLRELTS